MSITQRTISTLAQRPPGARPYPAAQLLLLHLAHLADVDGAALVSQQRLAELMGVNGRSVRRCLSELQRLGLVSVEHTARAAVYRLHLDEVA